MHRGGRVAGRTRFTSYGALSTKVNKGALCGASERNKRGIAVPLASKNRTGTSASHENVRFTVFSNGVESARRGVSTVDVLAFSSAIRGASLTQPLFEKVGVMRYDPLKKNMVRPFRYMCTARRCTKTATVCCRALFSFMFGLVRGVFHSALTLGVTPLRLFLSMKKTKSAAIDSKSKSLSVCYSEQLLYLTSFGICGAEKGSSSYTFASQKDVNESSNSSIGVPSSPMF